MDITVVVPTYNDGRDLEPTLRALAAQTVPHKLIVVDNGSGDPPTALVARYGATLLHESKPGSYAARNRALKDIKGGIVAFTDSDCRPRPDWLEQATKQLGDEIVVGDVRNVAANPDKPTLTERYEMLRGFPIADYASQGFGVTANLVTKRSVLKAVGGFDDTLLSNGDKDFCLRAGEAGFPVRFVPAAIVDHPARRRFGELASKFRRIEGGEFSLETRGRRWRALLQKWLLWPIVPVRFLARYKKAQGLSLGDMFVVGWVLQGIRWVRAVERTRLCFGGSPRR